MKVCPAIIAALPREVKQLVRGWQEHRLPGKIVAYTNEFAVVACAGMGPERAALAVQVALSLKPVTALLSVGLAGACDPMLRVGDIVRAGIVIDARTGERFSDPSFRETLITTSVIAGVMEKQRLYESYKASAVDMEAATIARLAQAHRLSFRAVKSISDEASFEMQELAQFATADGQFREAAFAAHSAVRPHLWPKLLALAGNSKRAVQSLTSELESQLHWYRQQG
ncbi:phosphorylase [Edaphobacter paludis]|uniref:Phosphorylase n=1 Tax=Edaphobacter paludis TaxID=3035702 RepID=A0AAU7D2R8_9BACT